MAADHALEPGSHGLEDLFRDLQGKALTTRGGDDGRRHDMLRGLLERGREPERFNRVFAGSGLNGDQSGSTDGQCARLVEHHRMRSRERRRGAPPGRPRR
jgi:hypothetical protein